LLRTLSNQELLDLVDGAAIFSAGGGGDPDDGHRLVDNLASDGFAVKLANPSDVPDNAKVVNFAVVGATTTVEYESDAAVTAFKSLEEYAGFSAYAVIPVELGGFNTVAAIDVASRCGIPVLDADGAGRSVPEVHLKVYTIDDIPLTPMVVANTNAKNIVVVKETIDSKAAERIARTLAAEWDNSAYTARRILTGSQVKTSPIQLSLSKSIRIGRLLNKTVEPTKAILKEIGGFKLFEGVATRVKRETKAGFTFVDVKLRGTRECAQSMFEFKAKNEVLVAYRNGKLAAIAPDIITPVHPETGKCITAEKIGKDNRIAVLGLPAPEKWRTSRGLELWKDVLQRSDILDEYSPVEQLA
jgi:DUF917 family protein